MSQVPFCASYRRSLTLLAGFRPRPLNILSVKTAASDTAGEVDEVDEHSRVNRERKPNRQSLPDKLPTMIPKLP